MWDARTGQELKGEPTPPTIANQPISPDGRLIAHPVDNLVELVPLQPDEEELSYRLLHAQPNLWCYREGYKAARAAKDDFAARFYLKLLPPPEQKILKAQAAADREIDAGRTSDALGYLVIVSAARADDTSLALRVAELQAWFGQDKELADTGGRALEAARGTFDPRSGLTWPDLLPKPHRGRNPAGGRVGSRPQSRGAREVGSYLKPDRGYGGIPQRPLRGGRRCAARRSQWRQGQPAGGRHIDLLPRHELVPAGQGGRGPKLATEAAATMKPLPQDEKNPLTGDADHDDLILWLAYKEAKALLKFDAVPLPEAKPDQK